MVGCPMGYESMAIASKALTHPSTETRPKPTEDQNTCFCEAFHSQMSSCLVWCGRQGFGSVFLPQMGNLEHRVARMRLVHFHPSRKWSVLNSRAAPWETLSRAG